MLAIDPSHLLRNGMEGMQAEANTIFHLPKKIMFLFDEFDELVKERITGCRAILATAYHSHVAEVGIRR